MITVSAEVEMYLGDNGRVVISSPDVDDIGGREITELVKEYCNMFSFDDGILSADCVDAVEDLKRRLETSLRIVDDYIIKTRQYELQQVE